MESRTEAEAVTTDQTNATATLAIETTTVAGSQPWVEVVHASWGNGPGQLGIANSKLLSPTSFAVGSEGAIYILDPANQRIVRFEEGSGTQTIPSEATNPKDIAVAGDGTIVVDDTAGSSRAFLAYARDGSLVGRSLLPDGKLTGYFVTSGGTVYSLMGINEEKRQSAYVPVYRGGLVSYDSAIAGAQPGRPFATGQGLLAISEEAVVFSLVEDGGIRYQTELKPKPSFVVASSRLSSGEVILAGSVSNFPDMLERRIWIIDEEGNQTVLEAGTARNRVGYIHRDVEVTCQGEVYFMNSDEEGVSIARTSIR